MSSFVHVIMFSVIRCTYYHHLLPLPIFLLSFLYVRLINQRTKITRSPLVPVPLWMIYVELPKNLKELNVTVLNHAPLLLYYLTNEGSLLFLLHILHLLYYLLLVPLYCYQVVLLVLVPYQLLVRYGLRGKDLIIKEE